MVSHRRRRRPVREVPASALNPRDHRGMPLSIREVVSKVHSGQLRIPAFQRGFVWDAERVAFLMDSLYKGYPFGSIIIWRTKSQLRTERNLGPFELPDNDPDYPIDYVLDGQQRLTSIFGVFQTDLAPIADSDTSWTKIYFDFDAEEDLQESQFLALSDDEALLGQHFPISTFFDSVAYRAATHRLRDEQIRQIDDVQAVFKEAAIPTQVMETDDRAKVAIVFERVNRLGVELDTFQLLSAWTWSDEFDLQERFGDLSEQLEPFGFSGVGDDTNLLLRCCSAIVGGDVSAPGVLELNGSQVRDRFDHITNGLRGAIDFLRANMRVANLVNLPYPSMLVPLAVFFAAPDGTEVAVSDAQRQELTRWFWRSVFTRRFSGGVLRNLKRDIDQARSLRTHGHPGLGELNVTIDEDWFLDNRFTVSAVNTKTFVLAMAQKSPRSFVSGVPIGLEDVLQRYNRREFHHLYPRAYLRKQGRANDDINRLANFAFVSATDNKKLGGVAPSNYREQMPNESIAEILESAICPESLLDDDYETFLSERSSMLAAHARKLCGLPPVGA